MSSNINLTSPAVTVEWLHKNLNAENLVVLNGTIPKVVGDNSGVNQNQIVGARFFDIKKKFSDVSAEFPNTFPSPEQFQKEARALGINTDSAIVVYDDLGIYSSARVWWLFKAFGFTNVAVLSGGLLAWEKAGYPTENASEYQGNTGNFVAKLHPEFMKFFDDVKQASTNNTHKIIDARSENRFKGIEAEPRAGLRSGTIPNSINIPFTNLLDDGVLKPDDSLKTIFNDVAQNDEPIIFSCGSGITACVLALGAEISGYKNISVYDGSWTEWGSLVPHDMENPTTWTKDELMAYILLFVAHSDLNETYKEKEYILSRVDKHVFTRVYEQFEKDNDYQSIQHIVEAVKTHDYYRNDLVDLFADIKLMAFADGEMDEMENMVYTNLKKILK